MMTTTAPPIAHHNPPTDIINAVRSTVDDRSIYRAGLLDRTETWSGSSLRGKARSYGASYNKSRQRLIMDIRAALPDGWAIYTALCFREGPRRWTRELVIESPEWRYVWGCLDVERMS